MALVTSAIIAIAALAVSAGAAYASYQQNQAAAKDRKQANAVSAAQAQVNQQNAIRDQIRQERIRRAQIIASSANTGTQASSGELGTIGSIGTQAGANIGTIQRNSLSASTFSLFEQRAADASSRAATYGQVSSLAGSAAGAAMKTPSFQGQWDSWFGSPNTGINPPPKG